jgi:hypothetical protein
VFLGIPFLANTTIVVIDRGLSPERSGKWSDYDVP